MLSKRALHDQIPYADYPERIKLLTEGNPEYYQDSFSEGIIFKKNADGVYFVFIVSGAPEFRKVEMNDKDFKEMIKTRDMKLVTPEVVDEAIRRLSKYASAGFEKQIPFEIVDEPEEEETKGRPGDTIDELYPSNPMSGMAYGGREFRGSRRTFRREAK